MPRELKNQNWKLELRYGRLVTPYKYFTVIADGVVGELHDAFECRPGPAAMSIKTWADDANESAHMARIIGQQIGFSASGRVEVYETEAEHPPRDNPHGYDIKFFHTTRIERWVGKLTARLCVSIYKNQLRAPPENQYATSDL